MTQRFLKDFQVEDLGKDGTVSFYTIQVRHAVQFHVELIAYC